MRPLEGRNVVWRFAACYHMWRPTLVLVFIPLPHICWPGFLNARFWAAAEDDAGTADWNVWGHQRHHVCQLFCLYHLVRLLLKISWHYQWHSPKAPSCWKCYCTNNAADPDMLIENCPNAGVTGKACVGSRGPGKDLNKSALNARLSWLLIKNSDFIDICRLSVDLMKQNSSGWGASCALSWLLCKPPLLS